MKSRDLVRILWTVLYFTDHLFSSFQGMVIFNAGYQGGVKFSNVKKIHSKIIGLHRCKNNCGFPIYENRIAQEQNNQKIFFIQEVLKTGLIDMAI